MISDEFKICSVFCSQLTNLDTESTSQVIRQPDNENNKLEKEIYTNLESLFNNQ